MHNYHFVFYQQQDSNTSSMPQYLVTYLMHRQFYHIYQMVKNGMNLSIKPSANRRFRKNHERYGLRKKHVIVHIKADRPRSKTALDKEFSSSNIPRNINTKIRKPMDQNPLYKQLYQKADPKLYNPSYPKHKIGQPLFLLRLHSRLSVLPIHLELFCALTEEAAIYINERIKFIQRYWKNIKNNLYDRKFQAYSKLLNYLRVTSHPSNEAIYGLIRCGIYGERKSKFSKQVKNKVDKCCEYYSNFREGINGLQI